MIKCTSVHCSFPQRLLQSFVFLFTMIRRAQMHSTYILNDQKSATKLRFQSTFLAIRLSASLLCLNACQCTAPMHCANAVHIFYHLLFSSLLSINARYFKMYLIKVLLRSFMFFFIAIECTYRQ